MVLGVQRCSGLGAFSGGGHRLDELDSFAVILDDRAAFGLVVI